MAEGPVPTSAASAQAVELPKMPAVWPGYLAAVLFFLAEVWQVAQNPGLTQGKIFLFDPILSPIAIAGWVYWLYCVYRYHDVIAQIRGYEHSITPWKAVGMHFVPIYGIIWIFRWPSEMAAFVNWRTQSQTMRGWVAGLFVLIGFLLVRLFDGAIGLGVLFTAGIYISRRLTMAFSAPPVPASAMAPPGVRGPLGL